GGDLQPAGGRVFAERGDDSEIATLLSQAIQGHLLVEIEHYKEDQDTFTSRTIEPYSLMNGREGWYVHTWDREREAPRDFRLDRIKTADVTNDLFEPRDGMVPDLAGWARTGTLDTATTAKIWISPERAARAKEEYEPSLELKDGAILIDLPYGGINWLVTEIFKFAGDAVVLEPEDARAAVSEAAKSLAADLKGGGLKAASTRPRPAPRKKPVAAG
ncbi:MAG: WYL domain-containing protein, partial [Solirubrobacterales bacterium]